MAQTLKRIRGKLSYANVMATGAMFVAIGGTAAAVDGPNPGQNTIGSEDIIGNEIKSDDLGNGRIFNLDIADDIIQGGKIKDETVTGTDVADNTLRASDLQADAVSWSEMDDDSVASDEIQAAAVGSSEIGDNTVGSNELKGVGFYSDTKPFQSNAASPKATCPDNHQLLSGGGELVSDTYNPHHVLENMPEGNGWRYTAVSHVQNSTASVRAWAVCMAP